MSERSKGPRVAPGRAVPKNRFFYAYAKLRHWHVGMMSALCPAIRYALTGDTGKVRSHGGWRKSRLRIPGLRDTD
ncbi:hypothetical protein QE373_002053 [Stenotrophomonas sp. SORGH_AS321]|nr:hypothetical protein [Stenotrophomonas sp. SORGH_AS_0321]